MTLPDERYRAVQSTRRFLLDLCDPKKTPRVPQFIRQQAHSLLRHYPDDYHMDCVSKTSPQVFQPRMEDVAKMFAKYQQAKDSKNSS